MPNEELQEIAKVFEGAARAIQNISPNPDPQSSQFNKGSDTPAPQGGGEVMLKTHGQLMLEAYPDGQTRERMSNMIKAELERQKINTGDIQSFLQATLSVNETFVMNEDTPVSNIISLYGRNDLFADSWIYIERTRKFSGMAPRMNPEDKAGVTAVQTMAPTYHKNLQAVQFAAANVEVGFMAQAQAGQQQNVDLMQQQVTPVLNAINQRFEYDAIHGEHQLDPTVPNIPAMGGIIEQIVTNIDDSGNMAILEEQVEAIHKALNDVAGQGKQHLIVTSYNTTGSLRDIMLQRYNGNNPRSFQEANAVLASKFQNVKVTADQVYEPIAGRPIPVVCSDKLVNTLIMFVLDSEMMPNWVRFQFKGQAGPQMFVNYDHLTRLVEGGIILEGRSLDRGPEQTRHLETGVL